jgi:ankyrin repeat protein
MENHIEAYELFVAARYGDIERLMSLLNSGTDVNTKDRLGWTALMYACENGQEEAVERLLKAGADVNARSLKGWTALIPAARHGYTHIIHVLIRAGIDVNAATGRGWTALKTAVFWNNYDTARALLDAGANPMDKGHDRDSILECALRHAGTDMIQLLRQRRARVA